MKIWPSIVSWIDCPATLWNALPTVAYAVPSGALVDVLPSTCTKNTGAGTSVSLKKPFSSVTAFAAGSPSTLMIAPTTGMSEPSSFLL